MKYSSKLTRVAAAVALSIGIAGTAFAQETTSAMRGKIVGPQGNAVTDATITIVHKPSGLKKTIKVNESGSFVANGLRVGGPYSVTVDSDKFEDKELNNIYLTLGEVSRVNTQLESKGQAIENIVVVGSRHALLNSGKSGPGSTYGADDINRAPAFNRDLKDILRSNPLVSIDSGDSSEMSIAGNNPRFNSLTVDGVRQNDDFGLNNNGYPTQRSPVSLLSLEQVSVNTAPYTVKSGNFSGGSIDAVTKSGTNDYEGEFFYEYDSDSLASSDAPEFQRKVWGGAVGGPIIEDKLFFFGTYEKMESPFVTEFGPAGSGAPNELDVLQSDIDQIVQIANDVYGVDAGVASPAPDEEDEKIMVKLDWNINDDHRASFTYQFNEGSDARRQGTFQSSRGDEIGLSSHWYMNNQEVETYSAHFYSYWSDEFSTELKVGYKTTDNRQESLLGKQMGDVRIGTSNGTFVSIGPDVFRHGNKLDNDNLTVRLVGEYLWEDHSISFGTEYEKLEVINTFVPWSLGEWRFDSIEDFANRNASRFNYSNAFSGNPEDAEANFEYETHVFFIEDKWDISSDLWVNFGVRYEKKVSDDLPTFNANFYDRYGITNTENLDGEDLVLPRFGFNWLADDNLTIRGGIGRFGGGNPNVWISNSFSNDGVTNVRANTSNVDLSNADITSIPEEAFLEPGDGFVNAIDPNFELPSDWRYSIAADYTADFGEFFGDNWQFTAEYLIINKDKTVAWKDLFREFPDDASKGPVTGPDGRNIYRLGSRDRYDILLTNAEGGMNKSFSLSVFKAFDNGIKMNFSYANQDNTEVVPGTSSTATSNYAKSPVIDRNNPGIGNARFMTEHAFKLNLSYTHQFFDGLDTRFSLYGERSSGRPYSWVYQNGVEAFGDQGQFDDSNEDLYLPYIPTGADDAAVTYANGMSYDELVSILNKHGLSTNGGIMGKNTERGPWVSRLDLKVEQEIPGFWEGHKGTVYFDIKNLLNLIDSSSGKVYRTNFFNGRSLVDVSYDEANNQYIYSPVFTDDDGNAVRDADGVISVDDTPQEFRALQSAWRLKIGINYKF